MWTELPCEQKEQYKKLILIFSSLTKIFSQKSDLESLPKPYINSKFQETVFQKAFHAKAEDIANTSYDASIIQTKSDGQTKVYLIGIKSFLYSNTSQKVAQFKKNHKEWSHLIEKLAINTKTTKDAINLKNKEHYLELAQLISDLRNKRIKSSKAQIIGFDKKQNNKEYESVYHVLMPHVDNDKPIIYVGEIDYDEIDIDKLQIIGCTSANNPDNFEFTDGKHFYKFTSADSQLYMNFDNSNIIRETWNVDYIEDVYSYFLDLATKTTSLKKATNKLAKQNTQTTTESHYFNLVVEPYSGFNAFNSVSSKLSKEQRANIKAKILTKYAQDAEILQIKQIATLLQEFINKKASNDEERKEKEQLRFKIVSLCNELKNKDFCEDVFSKLYRPINELYIPIQNARKFHLENPDFFGKDIGKFMEAPHQEKLLLEKKDRVFNMIFEPSKTKIKCYISQDNGKAIMSLKSQDILGAWLLRGVFQLREYEPLTKEKLDDLNIKGYTLTKDHNGDIHFEFVNSVN